LDHVLLHESNVICICSCHVDQMTDSFLLHFQILKRTALFYDLGINFPRKLPSEVLAENQDLVGISPSNQSVVP